MSEGRPRSPNPDVYSLPPAEPSPADILLKEVTEAFAAVGFDLVQPLGDARLLTWDESLPPATLPPPFNALERPLAVVVGNTRALWPHFVTWLNADLARRQLTDPLDTYSEQLFAAVAARLPVPSTWRGAWERPPRQMDMLRAAHLSGLGTFSRAMLAIHRQVGLWFGLRGVLLLGIPDETRETGPGSERVLMPWLPCLDCSAPCEPPLMRATELFETHREEKTHREENPSSIVPRFWEAWLAIRDACPVGREYRYSDEQIAFHYRRMLPEAPAETLAVQPEQGQGDQHRNSG